MSIVLERRGRLYLAGQAHIIRATEDLDSDSELASEVEWDIATGNPFVKWISGNYVQSGNPNSNNQFWASEDLEFGDYSIRYAPLNMIHKVRQPLGFFLQTRRNFAGDDAADETQDFTVQALAGMWGHIFPFESSLVDQADSAGLLYLSMECRGEKITCAGDQGCGKTFDYMSSDDHCEHLKDRSSVRHLVNPTFRGGALIIPPVNPGWQGATAQVYQEAVMEEASRYAEQHEAAYEQAKTTSDMTPHAWESLMAAIISSAS